MYFSEFSFKIIDLYPLSQVSYCESFHFSVTFFKLTGGQAKHNLCKYSHLKFQSMQNAA